VQFEQPSTPDMLQLKYAEAYFNHGNRLGKLGRLDDAIVYYLKTLDIKPNFIEVYTNLGNVLAAQGRLNDAIASFKAGLKLHPDSVDFRNSLGLVLHSQGKFSEADSFYCEALKLTPIDEPYLPYFAFLGNPIRHFWMMGTIAMLQKSDRQVKMLEVGTWAGSSFLTWDQCITSFHSKGGTIQCVDPWKPYLKVKDNIHPFLNSISDYDIAFRIFCHNKNTASCKVDHYRGVSKKILPGLESSSFDIVYIDGSHYYDDVVKDIQEGCRLVRDGGYICGDDLEIQWDDANQEHAQKHKDEDYVQDPKGRYYHPGVTVAVYDVLGKVTCHEGYWVMQKQGDKLNRVRFKEFDHFMPPHFPTDWKTTFKDYVNTLSTEVFSDGYI